MNRIIVLSVLILSTAAAMAVAQPQRQPRPPRPGTPEFIEWELLRRQQQQAPAQEWAVSGKIDSFNVRAGEVNVVSDDNQRWRVKFGDGAQVSVKGEGGAEFLQPRAAVRFYAPITKRKMVTEPVAKMEAFSPRDQFEPMLEPTTEEEARAAMAEEETTEEGAEVADDEGEVESESEVVEDDRPALTERINRESKESGRGSPKRNRDGKANEDGPPEWYHVQGVLLSVKKGKFIVDAGEGGKIRGELAEGVEVTADLVGIQFAKPGDVIQATGRTFPAQPQTAVATKADVTLVANPESTEENPRRGNRNKGRRVERNKEAELGDESEQPEATRRKQSTR